MGSVPPVDSITISDQIIPVEIFTEATCEIRNTFFIAAKQTLLHTADTQGTDHNIVGNQKFPFVHRLARKISSEVAGLELAGSTPIPVLLSSRPK